MAFECKKIGSYMYCGRAAGDAESPVHVLQTVLYSIYLGTTCTRELRTSCA